MPPKVKITKSDIIEKALCAVRRSGVGAVNARSIAEALGCSTQPIFSNFATMDELMHEVSAAAYSRYLQFLQNEDKTGTPFVGRAGKLLDQYLFAVDIPRESVYIANILKCRPPKNRDPLPAEEDACMDFLRRQVKLIKPKIIVCLGRISAMRLIRPDYKITKEHGEWVKKGNFLITAVYHPALLLRDPRKKEEMLEDMKKIKAKLDELCSEEI